MAGKQRQLPDMVAIGRRLTRARLDAGYPTISDLARELQLRPTENATRKWLSEVESGKALMINPAELLSLKRTLGISLDHLVAGEDKDGAPERPFAEEMRIIGRRLDDDGERAVLNVAMFQAEESRRRAQDNAELEVLMAPVTESELMLLSESDRASVVKLHPRLQRTALVSTLQARETQPESSAPSSPAAARTRPASPKPRTASPARNNPPLEHPF